ncbi:hypothetical protein BH11PLA2_BH11PLA2_24820 [soil metagenome]
MSVGTIVSETPRTPFGLPTGSVRGIISVLICAFFWVILLWPQEHPVTVVLAHFFLLGLVLMAFASAPHIEKVEGIHLIPWLLRVIFVGGSAAVVAIAWYRDPILLQQRLTPNGNEVATWWVPFLACTFGGFALGQFLRFIMGRDNHIFRTIRAWLSVVGMVMLAVEIALVIAFASTSDKSTLEFLHIWDCFELAIVSAYFGTRA